MRACSCVVSCVCGGGLLVDGVRAPAWRLGGGRGANGVAWHCMAALLQACSMAEPATGRALAPLSAGPPPLLQRGMQQHGRCLDGTPATPLAAASAMPATNRLQRLHPLPALARCLPAAACWLVTAGCWLQAVVTRR